MEKEVSYAEIQKVSEMLVNASKDVCTRLYEYINWYVKKEYSVNNAYISFKRFPIKVGINNDRNIVVEDISKMIDEVMTKDTNINKFYQLYIDYVAELTLLYKRTVGLYDPISGKSDMLVISRDIYSKHQCDYNAIFLYDFPEFKTIDHIDNVIIKNYEDYLFILDFLKEYDNLIKEEKPKEKIELFMEDRINPIYRNRNLEEFDLKQIDFDNKNISGLDISHNIDTPINFDKLVKDLSDCNINGYNLKGYTFNDFNLKNCDMRNTYASVELSTCSISFESKINSGTLFDENNDLLFNGRKLNKEELELLGIQIFESTINDNTEENVEEKEDITIKKKIKNIFKKKNNNLK